MQGYTHNAEKCYGMRTFRGQSFWERPSPPPNHNYVLRAKYRIIILDFKGGGTHNYCSAKTVRHMNVRLSFTRYEEMGSEVQLSYNILKRGPAIVSTLVSREMHLQ
jgi:hypothetical protein